MPIPTSIKSKLKITNDEPSGPMEKADNMIKIEKNNQISAKGIITRLENMKGIIVGLPLHKTFSSARKCLFN